MWEVPFRCTVVEWPILLNLHSLDFSPTGICSAFCHQYKLFVRSHKSHCCALNEGMFYKDSILLSHMRAQVFGAGQNPRFGRVFDFMSASVYMASGSLTACRESCRRFGQSCSVLALAYGLFRLMKLCF